MYVLQMMNPMTNLGRGTMHIKNIVFIFYSVFFASILAIDGGNDRIINKIFMALITSSVLYGLYQGITGFTDIDFALHRALLGEHSVNSLLFNESVRPIGFSINNAHYYNMITLLMIFLYSQYRLFSEQLKLLYYFILSMYMIFMVMFPERTQIAMFFIGIFVVKFIFSHQRSRYILFAGGGIIALIITVNIIFPNISNSVDNYRIRRVVELLNILNAETFLSRSSESGPWINAFNMIMDRPIIGYGSGTGTQNRAEGLYIGAHNDYLSIWIELGLIGFMIFLLLIYMIFKKSVQESKSDIYFKCLYAGAAGLLAPVLINGIFNIVIISGATSRIVWFGVGYAVVKGRIMKSTPKIVTFIKTNNIRGNSLSHT
jgi:O-antigen ligase